MRSALLLLLAAASRGQTVDECTDYSDAVQCKHVNRYTSDGCLCSCDWTAIFKDGNGNVITLPAGPGSTEPCGTGCCNPDSKPTGDWCYIATHDYNKNKPACSALQSKSQTCVAAGTTPTDGGLAPRAAIPGVPSTQNNLCTDAGQLCVDTDKTATGNWECQCVAPQTGTAGQQKLATCATETDECTANAAKCGANQRCVDPSKTTTSDWYCECTVGPPTKVVGGPATCTTDKDECTDYSDAVECKHVNRYTSDGCLCSCDWTAIFKDGNGNVITLPAGPGSTEPCGTGCCNPDSKPTGDWCYIAAHDYNKNKPACSALQGKSQTCVAAGTTPTDGGLPPRAAIPGVPSTQNNLCTDAGQLCVDTDKTATGNWECQCVAPQTGTAGQQKVATCATEVDECTANAAKCGANQRCVDPSKTTTSDWYCECTVGPPTKVVGGPATCTTDKDECTDYSDAVQCKHVNRYTSDGCLCSCDWTAIFKDGNGNVITLPAGPGSTEPCGTGCCNPDSKPTGDWCYIAAHDYNKNKPACSALQGKSQTCVAAGTTPTDGGLPPRAAIPGVPSTQNNLCTDAGQLCVDTDKTATGNWECQCVAPQTGPAGQQKVAKCATETDECTGNAAKCGANQRCVDPSKTTTSDWYCECTVGPPTKVVGGPATCTTDKDECTDYSDAVQCKHVNRYTSDGCLCSCDWTAIFKDGNGNVITLPAGPGSTEPCGTGCCNPDSKPTGDWCYIAAHDYNKNKPACSALQGKSQTCVAAGQAPTDGGLPPRAAIPGVPSTQNNLCTDAGQLCVDTDKTATGNWECQCVAPQTGTAGQQKVATCTTEVDECIANAAKCGANQRCVDPSKTTTTDWYCECTVGPPTKVVGGPATCATDKDECTDYSDAVQCKHVNRYTEDGCLCSCDWTAIFKDGNGNVITLPAGPGSTEPCGTGCCNPDSKPTGDWCYIAAHDYNKNKPACSALMGKSQTCVAAGQAPTDGGLPPRAAIPGVPSTQNNLCTDAGQLCVDTDKTATGNWECQCVAPQTGTAGQQKVATCATEVDECTANAAKCGANQRCVDPSKTTTSDWYCECTVGPPTKVVGGPATCTTDKDECTDYSDAVQCKHVNRYTSDGCLCSCDWTAIFKDGNGNVITLPAGPGSTEPCGTGCCNPDSKPTGDWCYIAAHDYNKNKPACSALMGKSQTCVAAGQAPTDGGLPPRAAIPGVPSTQNNLCTDAGQLCVDTDKTATGNWECQCVAPQTGTAGQQKPATCTTEIDECIANAAKCGANQRCVDPTKTTTSDWYCECTVGPPTKVVGGPATCTTDKDECTDYSDAVQCKHVNRYTEDGCLCSCDWTAIFKDGNGNVITLPAGPGSTEPCGTGCCNPDSKPTGDWCYIAAHDYNKNKPACSALMGKSQTCVAPGQAPSDGGAPPRPAIPGIPSTQNNLCTDKGQLCVDTDKTATGNWQCECVAPQTGAPGQQKPATCTTEIDECTANAAKCGANQRCVDPSKTTTSDWYCECTVGPPTKVVGGPATCTTDKDECTDYSDAVQCKHVNRYTSDGCLCSCDWTAIFKDGNGNVITLPAGPGSTEPCGTGCCNPDSKPTGDWCYIAAHDYNKNKPACSALMGKSQTCVAPGQAPSDGGAPPRPAIPGVPSTQNNLCTDKGQLCVDTDKTATGNWQCECVAPQTGAPGQQKPATCTTEIDECTANAAKCGANQRCVDPSKTTTSDWYCECTVGPPTKVVGGPATCTTDKDECTDYSDAVQCKHVNRYTEDGCLCSCDWTAIFKDGNGNVITLPAGPGSTEPCGTGCCNPDSKPTGDWCYIAAHDYNKNKPACSALMGKSQTCVAPGQAPTDGGVTPRAAIPGVPSTQNNLCTDKGQLCVDTDKTATGNWQCKCVDPQTGTPGEQKVASCVVDECTATCDTCEAGVCEAQSQLCEDPNQSPDSLGDWMCKCPPPSQVSAVRNVAVCDVDECERARSVCAIAGQVCVDPSGSTLGDWECHCPPPAVGKQTKGLAVCLVDECQKHGIQCTSVGQLCVDPDKSKTDDWICRCPPPSVGADAPQKAATCVLVGECEDVTKSDVCTSVGQTCEDPDKAKNGDWMCKCLPPATGTPVVMGKAVCLLDECVAQCATCAGTVCSDAGQLCEDVDQNPVTGSNSWECRCPPPATGTKVTGVASCAENECDVHGPTCTAAGQDCVDPNTQQTGDWQCVCKLPAVGLGTRVPAQCVIDECDVNGVQCTSKGQTCYDPSTAATSLGDWMCQCAAPAQGSATAGPATCTVDECTLYGAVCTAEGQVCVDTQPQETGTWSCTCPPPHQNIAMSQAAALCVLDECKDAYNNMTAVATQGQPNICEQNGQTCIDPDTSLKQLGNWMCRCPGSTQSAVGSAVLKCHYDECAIQDNADKCSAGQKCVDDDWENLFNWECRCTAPSTGSALKGPANCTLDECKTNEKTCHAAGQVCLDTDIATDGTWECHCPPTSTGGKALMKPADCIPPKSECTDPTVLATCTNKGQSCIDNDETVPNDWKCECLPPATGTSVAGAPATCVLDECLKTCPTCAGDTCQKARQVCVDPNTDGSSLGDWMCKCTDGAVGNATAKAATCTLDECAVTCHTCADHGVGNTCENLGLLCHDPNQGSHETSDWMCQCQPPAVGNRTLGIPQCLVDECVVSPGEPPVCGATQICTDPNKEPTSLKDFQCSCVTPGSPATGTAVGKPATCIVNECNDQVNYKKCADAGQVCIDAKANATSLGDWECHCADGTGSAPAGPAACIVDECKDVCPTCANTGSGNVCEKGGQQCVDPNTSPTSQNDWMCQCTTGSASAVGNLATCVVDECVDVTNFGALNCSHVPRTTVTGCECECGWSLPALSSTGTGPGIDSDCLAGCCNPTGRPEGEWCIIKNTGANTMNPECSRLLDTNKIMDRIQTCTAPGKATQTVCQGDQICVDPDKSPQSVGDWRCECQAPAVGATVIRGPAVCITDYCQTQGSAECAAAGQQCVSEGQGWKCLCPNGAQGEQVGGVAKCTYPGDCEKNAIICTQVGQTCYDPDTTKADDWVCKCVSPSTGVSNLNGPAVCKLDECTAVCPTCANKGDGNVCQAAGQRCEEGSLSPADRSDWRCACPVGQGGSKALAPATCLTDECQENNALASQVCGASGQTCVDPDMSVAGDWRCVCQRPAVGEATGRVAVCVWDECLDSANNAVCTAAGQVCKDSNPSPLSKDNWYCDCPNGVSSGYEFMKVVRSCKPATWCETNGATCQTNGQLCVTDPADETKGRCQCVMPETHATKPAYTSGSAVAADCILDECVAVCETCARTTGGWTICELAQQACVEGSKSPSSTNDWKCQCKTGQKNTAVGAVATCTVNECDDSGSVCTKNEQICVDPNTALEGDWYCGCLTPSVGKQVGGPAACKIDECVLHGKECSAGGQTCLDRNLAVNSLGDWECTCPPPAKGTAVAKAATCEYTGECADSPTAAVCEAVGQTCVDPNPEVGGNWECHCVPPQVGTVKAGSAASCVLDECRATCATCALKPGSQTHVCTAAEQDCVDPNTDPTSTGDWMCKCAAPTLGEQRGAAAICAVDECLTESNKKVCEGAKVDGKSVQVCVDPDQKTIGDWTCQCVWPYEGASGVRAASLCRVDECTADGAWSKGGQNGNHVCAEKGQSCLDPDTSVMKLEDWKCQCPNPADGSEVGKPVAKCQGDDKCVSAGLQCGAGQACVEQNGAASCACLAPLEGQMVNGRLVCMLDECRSHCETCAQKGLTHICYSEEQACVDRNTSSESLSDWSCVCQVGKGEALGAAAVCIIDECETNKGICESQGQICEDPNKEAHKTQDWMCQCVAPGSGSLVGGAASCMIDECLTHGKRCAEGGQQCVDPNKSPVSQGDWTCNCPELAQGSMQGGLATCTYIGGCNVEANRNQCSAAGQKCVPNPENVEDWRCACLEPFHGSPVAKGAAKCTINECDDICPTCARTSQGAVNVCTGAGQGCMDPSFDNLNDWMCKCQLPATAVAVGKPVAQCMVDECVAITKTGARQCQHFRRYSEEGCECACDWRATSTSGVLGTGPGYSEPCSTGCCNPDNSPTGEWCFLADSEFNRNKPECVAKQRKTCASESAPPPAGATQVQSINVCMEQNQICVDLDHSPTATGNWECRCREGEGQKALGVAVCEVNECKTVLTCAKAGQICRDNNTAPNQLNDWECVCAHGKGSRVGGVAECEYDVTDECISPLKDTQAPTTNAPPAPTMAPPTDAPTLQPVGEWLLTTDAPDTASPPATASPTRAPVPPGTPTKSTLCSDAGQFCYDPANGGSGDWECRCVPPAVTVKDGLQGVATCRLDECVAQCPTCADKGDGKGSICSSTTQKCVDPDTAADKLGDWMCQCVSPATGTAAAAQSAVCVYDECKIAEKESVCSAAKQDCVDPDTREASINDWMCVCRAPQTGQAIGVSAQCILDECVDKTNFEKCSSAGQTCIDSDQRPTATGDWMCRCPKPASGEAVKGSATCTYTGECADSAVSEVCTKQGQTCIDPDVNTNGDWLCQCVSPQTGNNGRGQPAKCGTDECLSSCPTCEQGACSSIAGQTCEDSDPAKSGDWMCKCTAPYQGTPAVGQAATCVMVECSNHTSENPCVTAGCVFRPDTGLCVPAVPNTPGTAPPGTTTAAPGTPGTPGTGGWGWGTNTTTLTLTQTFYNDTIWSAATGDGDDDCVLCWLLPLLLLLCCSLLLLAALLFKRRQQQNEADDEKWNKQFEAQLEDGDGEVFENRTPSRGGMEGDTSESLLQQRAGSTEMKNTSAMKDDDI